MLDQTSQSSHARQSAPSDTSTSSRSDESRYRALLEHSQDGIAVISRTGEVTYLSPGLERMMGRSVAERAGLGGFEFIHPDDLQTASDFFAQVLQQPNEPREFLVRSQDSDGRWRHLELVATNRLDAPEINGVVLNVRDVTARQRTAERQAALLAVARSLLGARTPQQVADAVLRHGLTALGAGAGSVAVLTDNGQHVEIICTLGHDPRHVAPFQSANIDAPIPLARVARSGKPLWITSRDELWRTFPAVRDSSPASPNVAWAAVPLLTETGPIGALGLSYAEPHTFDEDERAFALTLAGQCAQALDRARLYQEAEEARGAAVLAQERLRRQFNSQPNPAYVWRLVNGAIVLDDFNDAADRITQGAIRQSLGQTAVEMYPGDTLGIVADLRQCLAEQRILRREVRYPFQGDGQVRDLDVTYLFVPPDAVLVHTEDITARKEAELHRTNLARTEKMRALGQLASGVAHDLNQSLALIAGYGDLAEQLLDEPDPDRAELREALRLVAQAGMDGGETVKRLLTFSRGNVDGAPAPVDMGALLRDVARLTAPKWRDAAELEGRHISLLVETSEPEPLMVRGWAAGLREALTNLVFNAVDALPRGGGIKLRGYHDGERVLVEVRDTGVGIQPEVQQRIFEPFFSTKGDRGTGLGLAQVFGIVQQHQGEIKLASVPDRGTTFTLSFPAHTEQTPRIVPREDARPAVGALRILVVDDEPGLRQMLSAMLHGHAVRTVASAEEALNVLADQAFDLVVSDLGLGEGLSGWDLADRVRTEWPETRFALVTGWGAVVDQDEARRRGVCSVVAKPFRLADIDRLLRTASER